MNDHTARILIPAPASIRLLGSRLPLKNLVGFYVDRALEAVVPELERVFRTLGLSLRPLPEKEAQIVFKSGKFPAESWRMNISERGVLAEAGDPAGGRCAAGALAQMLFAAAIAGNSSAALDGAEIDDSPRFPWRGFLLDSARHFQDAGMIRQFLRILSWFRINTFHWHLTDGQGWRFPLASAGRMDGHGKWSDGQYTVEELRDVAAYAKTLGIRIVPEVDVPGHSAGFLARYPEYACDRDVPGNEWCIGNPESLEFLKRTFAELMEIFPDSPVIHIGGDEAATAGWEKCPRCRAAMEAGGFPTMRELENDFMFKLSRFIVENGRTPMIWGTCSGQTYPADTIIQAWLDIREPLKAASHGNKIVYSVHNSLYFDYPANLSEPWETWMFELSERGVYMTDPYIIWPEKVKDAILGTEACLWTETVPQHRIIAKLFPRIFAYSECAWSMPEKKSYPDLRRREELLDAAGFTDFLKERP